MKTLWECSLGDTDYRVAEDDNKLQVYKCCKDDFGGPHWVALQRIVYWGAPKMSDEWERVVLHAMKQMRPRDEEP